MKKAKLFFYKLYAAELFAKVRGLSDKECAKFIRAFASDLVAESSEDEFTIAMIEEAKKSRETKSLSGSKGAAERWKKP